VLPCGTMSCQRSLENQPVISLGIRQTEANPWDTVLDR